jgi:hypothetical protein
MTLPELLALLGRSWSRLLLYPGGLGLALALALGWVWRPPAALANHAWRPIEQISMLALPWLGVALLPLPYATALGRSLDLVLLLALLEWPQLLLAAREARGGLVGRLAALLNGYPALLAALLLLALPDGSLDLSTMAASPAGGAPTLARIGHWVGAVGLLPALMPLLGIGAFAALPSSDRLVRLGLLLRAIGIAAIAALPWVTLIPEGQYWLLPLPPIGVGLAIWGMHALGARATQKMWARMLLWLALCEIALLLLAASEGLAGRLR